MKIHTMENEEEHVHEFVAQPIDINLMYLYNLRANVFIEGMGDHRRLRIYF